jgi:tRNA synthetases class I (M)
MIQREKFLKHRSRRGSSSDVAVGVVRPSLLSVALLPFLAMLAMRCHAFSKSSLAYSKKDLWAAEAFHQSMSSSKMRSGGGGGGAAAYRTATARRFGASVVPTNAHGPSAAVGSGSPRPTPPRRLALGSLYGTPATSFDDGERPYQITTPIYYVNDKPHIGHAYTSVAADVLARYMRLSGRKVFFQSGTDEHGEKVQLSAGSRGVDTQHFVDSVSQNFRDMSELLNLQLDCFVRTTNEQHKRAVQVRRVGLPLVFAT